MPYVGKPDPVQLQETIRKLRQENQHLKEQVPGVASSVLCEVNRMPGFKKSGTLKLQKANN